jgi:hypothetical protein
MDLALYKNTIGTQFDAFMQRKQTITFSGSDLRVVVTATFQEDEEIVSPTLLTSLNGITISRHRDIFPVRALGNSNPLGWTYGNRTFAGTIIFAQMGDYGIRDILKNALGSQSGRPLPTGLDEIPSLDFHITLVNEAGDVAVTTLLGVKMLDEGESFTVDDAEWMSTVSYMALGMQPLTILESAEARIRIPEATDKDATAISGIIKKYYPWSDTEMLPPSWYKTNPLGWYVTEVQGMIDKKGI